MAKAKSYVRYIPASGEITTSDIQPTMEEVQKYCGGYIERLRLRDPQTKRIATMYLNENGFAERLLLNITATHIYHFNFGRNHSIVGNAILFFGWQGPKG